MKGIWSGALVCLLAGCGEKGGPPGPPTGPSPLAKGTPSVTPLPPDAPPPDPARETPKKPAPVDKKGRAKSPELFKRYMVLMEENGDLVEAIDQDLEAKRYESAVKPKVLQIRKNAEAARALHYRKDPDQETALEKAFDLFLLRMKTIEESTWTPESSPALLENLRGRCLACHDTFQ